MKDELNSEFHSLIHSQTGQIPEQENDIPEDILLILSVIRELDLLIKAKAYVRVRYMAQRVFSTWAETYRTAALDYLIKTLENSAE